MNRSPSDHELRFGLTAVSKHLLSPDELLDATVAWCDGDADMSFSESLVQRGVITDSQCTIVRSILSASDQKDQNGSLDNIIDSEVLGKIRNALERIDNAELRNTIQQLVDVKGADGSRTPTPSNDHARFDVTEALASGGLGDVFVARDNQLNRNVALKKIQPRFQSHAGANDRFVMEAEITGRLEHPGVVPVYALGQQQDGQFYYAMRLIRGVTLEQEVDAYFASVTDMSANERNLKLRMLLRRFIDVCNTIEYAHSRGVIHRDLKPSNIMLGKYGETLVVDWGLAKRVDIDEGSRDTAAESLLVPGVGSGSAQTQFGSAIGTPQYMSPEQAAGRLDQISPTSDVYSLGATFYYLLTGQPPCAGSSVEQILEHVKHNKFALPSDVRPDVAKPLEAICRKAMSLNGNDRYDSAADMATEIESWLADQKVNAYEEPVVSSLARAMRHHQTLVATGVASVIFLSLAAVTGSFVHQRSVTREQEHAQQLLRQEAEQSQVVSKQRAERRATAIANLEFGLVEAAAGRFQSARTFFLQGQQACSDDPESSTEFEDLSRRAEQMNRLIQYEQFGDAAAAAIASEDDQRAMILFLAALDQVGVFRHADWWANLPVEGLDLYHADLIEKQVHTQLANLSMLLGKNALTIDLVSRRTLGLPPPPFSDHQKSVFAALQRTIVVTQSYRPAQSLERMDAFRRWLMGEIQSMPDAPQWRADNFADAFILGGLCYSVSQPGKSGFARTAIQQFMGIEVDDQSAQRYVRRATELRPNNYLAHFLLGSVEAHQGNFDIARRTLSHAIEIRPDLVFSYDMRSYSTYQQAIHTDDPVERRRLLLIALSDADAAANVDPQYEIIHWLRGNSLRHLDQTTQAVAAYLSAFQHEPPVDMVTKQRWSVLLQGYDPMRTRRLTYLLSDRFAEARDYAQQLQQSEPDNPQFALLEAAALSAVGEWDDAEQVVARVLSLAAKQSDPLATTVAYAHVIRGESMRSSEKWDSARDEFAAALRTDNTNILAAEGLAAVLEEIADHSSDAQDIDLALSAFDNLISLAETDWQAVRGHEGRIRMLMANHDFSAAQDQIEALLKVDRGRDISQLVAVARSIGATSVTDKLEEYSLDTQLARLTIETSAPSELPLRNGGFELGLNSYWTPWSTTGGCVAEAVIDDRDPGQDNPSACLLVQHRSKPAENAKGVLMQSVPAIAGKRYRVSMDARGESLTEGAVQVVIGQNVDEPALILPTGSFGWQLLTGEFSVPPTDDGADSLTMIQWKLESRAPGKAWIDNVRIDRIVEDPAR